MTNNSPLPWKTVEIDKWSSQIRDAEDDAVATIDFSQSPNTITPELILGALNSHAQQKERIDKLIGSLGAIANIAGNIPDETLESGTSNDAKQRGIQLVTARAIARAALSKGGE